MAQIIVNDVSGKRFIKDNASIKQPFLTSLGRNGLITYNLKQSNRQDAFDLTGITLLKVVVKVLRSDADGSLDSDFPLTAVIVTPLSGIFTVDYATIDFTGVQDKVEVIFYNDDGAEPIPLSIMKSSVDESGI